MQHSRILALTVAIEDALNRGVWPDVHALLAERGALLNETQEIEPVMLDRILAADQRLQKRFREKRVELLKRMTRLKDVSSATKLYRTAAVQ